MRLVPFWPIYTNKQLSVLIIFLSGFSERTAWMEECREENALHEYEHVPHCTTGRASPTVQDNSRSGCFKEARGNL